MLDEARKVGSTDGEFVEFVGAGAAAKGAFRCSDCGYGVAVQGTLPQCPMCGGTSWEAGEA
jgi:rubrerythrin